MGISQRRMPRLRDMENFVLHAQGYELQGITDATPDIRTNETSYRPFGVNGDMSYIELMGGNLSMNALHEKSLKNFADILTDQDPDTTEIFQGYYPQEDVYVDVTKHLRRKDKRSYDRAELYPDWHTVLEPLVGNPGTYGTFTQSGICASPVAFQSNKDNYGVAILTDVIQINNADAYNSVSGKSGNFHWYKPTRIPTSTRNYEFAGKYALSVELQKRGLDNTLTDPQRQATKLDITQSMIQTVAGTALINPSTAPTVAIEGGGTPTSNVPGSNLSSGNYYYKYTALDGTGETLASTASTVAAQTATNGQINVTLTRVTDAVKYIVYRAKKDSAPSDQEYYYLTTVDDPGSGTTFDYEDISNEVDSSRVAPTAAIGSSNTTGRGVGKIFLSPADLKGTDWSLSDTDGKFFAFVTYLYIYDIIDPYARYLIGDGLNTYARWEIPSDVV